MRSTFSGIYVGLSGMRAQQAGLDITGHNIANANTPGYSRQRVVLTPNNPYTVPGLNRPISPGQIGTGVQVGAIQRVRDQFVETQLRTENATTGQWQTIQAGLEKLEMIFNEPSESGISMALDEFFQALQTLSQRPDDASARAVVRQSAALLTDSFNHVARQTREYQQELNAELAVKIGTVNQLAEQIADLNQRIVAISVTGDNPNDLLDQRDQLIFELSQLTNISVREQPNASITISIGGSTLVDYATVRRLEVIPATEQGEMPQLRWEGQGEVTPQITDGAIKGLLELRDHYIPKYKEHLDNFAKALAHEINEVHNKGYGLGDTYGIEGRKPIDFFVIDEDDPRGAAEVITLSKDILDSLDAIAAASAPTVGGTDPDSGPGDNQNLLEIINLQHTANISSDFYAGIMGE
ncbi:MAG: flagellar hook-associated protein FlgK [Firmicutes bacterium]|nr:flagellar hook-associated protein FlgK [Bacillota bacterium]